MGRPGGFADFSSSREIKVENCRLSPVPIPALFALLWEIVVDRINTRLLGSPTFLLPRYLFLGGVCGINVDGSNGTKLSFPDFYPIRGKMLLRIVLLYLGSMGRNDLYTRGDF